MAVRVDFTPMVDMNMLLITFFMLCTSLSKPQTMEISMPSNEKEITEEQLDTLKVWVRHRPEQASRLAGHLLKGKNKKNVPLLTAMARIYWEAGMQEQADAYVAMGKKVDGRSAALSVLEGDMALDRHEVGRACQLYEQATYFNPTCREAYLNYARVYRQINPRLATEKLLALKQTLPDCIEADRALAEIYYDTNQFARAIDAYACFIHTPQAAFHRIAMYCHAELHQYAKAAQAADTLFYHADPVSCLALDYRYHAMILTALKRYGEAVHAYREVLQNDYASSRDFWNRILRLDPSNETARKALGGLR